MDDNDDLTPQDLAIMRGEGGEPTPAETPVTTPSAAEPAAAVEKPAAETPATDAEPEVQKLVPHGAFEEERQRRKASDKELAAAREKLAFYEGQKAALEAGRKPAGMTEQEKIDWDNDPIAAGKALQAKLEHQENQARTDAQVREIISVGQADCAQFAEKEPQFFGKPGADGKFQPGAYEYLRQATAERLRADGVPEHQLKQAVDLAELRLINEARAMRMSPARAMWHWAHIAGFKPQVAAPAPVVPPTPTEAEKVATAEKGQQGGKSLGTVPSGSGATELTLAQIAEMDDDEFSKIDYVKALKGGRR